MTWDVIVVGGGSAGAAAASQCARFGLGTLLLERRRFEVAGASWVNGIFGAAFDEAGIARPSAPELRAQGHRFVLVAGWGPHSVAIDETGVVDVDMRLLVARLREDARAHGAELRDETRVESLSCGAAILADGTTLEAPIIIDASGLGGLFRRVKPRPRDVCAAAQGVYRIRDHDRAGGFFAELGAEAGETVCFASVAGGYSIVNARIEGDELSVLAGSLPALGHVSGRQLRDEFARRHDWIGEPVFGGHGPIPLHRPHRRLAFGEAKEQVVVRFGDSAGQVFAAHGSGIGAHLVGARMLAERLARDGPAGAFVFERAWHRRFGLKFLAADVFRRASMRLGPRVLATMIRTRMLPTGLVRVGFSAGL